MKKITKNKLLIAATEMDWQQVVLNGGPPCFQLQDDGHFCGRAKRWDGHRSHHEFVPFQNLLPIYFSAP